MMEIPNGMQPWDVIWYLSLTLWDVLTTEISLFVGLRAADVSVFFVGRGVKKGGRDYSRFNIFLCRMCLYLGLLLINILFEQWYPKIVAGAWEFWLNGVEIFFAGTCLVSLKRNCILLEIFLRIAIVK